MQMVSLVPADMSGRAARRAEPAYIERSPERCQICEMLKNEPYAGY